MMKEFLEAINNKLILQITFDSKEKGIIKRTCIPFDFGPSRKYKDGLDRYHFLDLDSPDGKHNLSILPDQVLNITLTNNTFNPADYISWTPNWHISRDWGEFS
jgi:hypothetical protein